MSETVNIGIIGTGGMGGQHAANLNNEVAAANIAAIMDVDAARAREVAESCGGAALYSDAEQLIAAPDVDAVLIAAPDRFHAGLTRGVCRSRQAGVVRKTAGDPGRRRQGGR